jgi:hypothetical protein
MIGSILGGIFGAKSASKQRRMLEEERKKNEQWYNRRYNEVGTERADAQAALTKMRDMMRERSESSRGASVVAGSSNERGAVEKAAQTSALAQAISDINVNNEARKDSIEAQYQSRDSDLAAQKLAAERQKAQAIAQAGAGLDKTINSVAGSFLGGIFGKK